MTRRHEVPQKLRTPSPSKPIVLLFPPSNFEPLPSNFCISRRPPPAVLKTDYPMRIVILPAPFLTGSKRSEPKDLSSPTARPFTSVARLSSALPFLSFQPLTTIKFSNSLVLTTIRNARGGWDGSLRTSKPSNLLTFKPSPQLRPASFIPFVFKALRTLFRNGQRISAFHSITCALFSVRRRVYPPSDAIGRETHGTGHQSPACPDLVGRLPSSALQCYHSEET
jgi:hypothetical protein